MKVKELIEELKKQDQELEVVSRSSSRGRFDTRIVIRMGQRDIAKGRLVIEGKW